MKECSLAALVHFFSYCEGFILYNCAGVCSRWRRIIFHRIDISLGKEDLKIQIYQPPQETHVNDNEIVLNREFTYIIDNQMIKERSNTFEDDETTTENDDDSCINELKCNCKKLVHSNNGSEKYSCCCSTIDCPCFNRNYHGGKHFLNQQLGVLELDYSFPIIECSDECSCDPSRCKNKLLPYHYMGTIKKPLYLFSSNGEGVGFGVKCKESIKKGEFISEYIGQVISDDQANSILSADLEGRHNYLLIIKEYFHNDSIATKFETRRLNINAGEYGNVSRFFNHSCEPNLTWRVVRTCSPYDSPKLFFFASKDIPENTELTFDYGEGSANDTKSSYSQRKCQCKSHNCRGFLPLISI